MIPRLIACSLTLLAGASVSAYALDCPAPSRIDNPATAAVVQKYLPDHIDLAAPDAMETAVFGLQRDGVEPDVLLNNLIATYCGSVASESGLSDQAKTQRVMNFSKSATQLVFSDVD